MRGKALYERLNEDEDLIKFEGIAKFHWTPDGKGIYIYQEGAFQKIDILTGKNRLFSTIKLSFPLIMKSHIHHECVDNNVHPGNTIQLIQALLKHNKRFPLMFYQEQRHGIRFDRYSEARMEYFTEHLKPEVK